MTCTAYEGGTCQETFVRHVKRVLAVWEELKPYYLKGVQRILGVELDPVEYAIVAHDLGKLAVQYQKGERRRYRHEVVSSYLAYVGLSEDEVDEGARIAISAAVLLHHEPIITSAYITGIGERYLPVYKLRKELENSDVGFACSGDAELFALLDKWGGLRDAVGKWKRDGLDVRDVLATVKRIIVMTSMGSPEWNHQARAKVGAVLYPLVVADGIAADIGRNRCEKCGEGGGTRVVRAAYEAELINVGRLVKKLCV